jgi:hypothetical protein
MWKLDPFRLYERPLDPYRLLKGVTHKNVSMGIEPIHTPLFLPSIGIGPI